MKSSGKKLRFLEPATIPNESDEETLQRLASVLRQFGINVVEDRPQFLNKKATSCKDGSND